MSHITAESHWPWLAPGLGTPLCMFFLLNRAVVGQGGGWSVGALIGLVPAAQGAGEVVDSQDCAPFGLMWDRARQDPHVGAGEDVVARAQGSAVVGV
eukprot:4138018-Pyramimonas_sp.AAC.1